MGDSLDCVGGHFWPFASAFTLPVFRVLAAVLMLVALLGVIVVPFTPDDITAGWTAVVAGFALFASSDIGTDSPHCRSGPQFDELRPRVPTV